MNTTHRTSRTGGYTVVELVLTAVMMVPIMLAVLSISSSVSKSVQTSERAGDVDDQLQRTVAAVERLLRPSLRTSIEVRADASDVAAAIAAGAPVPTIGDWVAAPDLSPRPCLRFTVLTGVPSAPSATATTLSLEFVNDANDPDNDLDDDGDGLIDEGTLFRSDGTNTVEVLRGVEQCSFAIENQLLRVTLHWARTDGATDTVQRAQCVHNIVIHNN